MVGTNYLSSIIIEDEPLAASLLVKYTRRYNGLDNKKVFTNCVIAGEYLRNHNVDLIFLDLHLPRIKGLTFLDEIRKDVSVILTTAYSQYALDGFDKGVVDYLLKPIEYPRFAKAVDRVRRLAVQNAITPTEYFFIKVNKSQVKIVTHQIIYLQSDKGYLNIHMKDGTFYRTKLAINDSLSLLNSSFLRIHKSYIINTFMIAVLDSNAVTLTNNKTLNIGRKYAKSMKNLAKELSMIER